MQPILILKFLVLLMLANGTPIIANRLVGARLSRPFDGGVRFFDEKPLFGSSKTLRGIILSVVCTSVGSLLIGMGWSVGALAACASMVGDLFSSFVKRRMNLAPGSRAIGLDQIPESLFPVLICGAVLPLTGLDMLAVVLLFFAGGLLGSKLLYKLRIRDRPH